MLLSKNFFSSFSSSFSTSKLKIILVPVLLVYVVAEFWAALTRRCIIPIPKAFSRNLLSARYDTIHINRTALRLSRSPEAVSRRKMRSIIGGYSSRIMLTNFAYSLINTNENRISPRSLIPSSILFMGAKVFSGIFCLL